MRFPTLILLLLTLTPLATVAADDDKKTADALTEHFQLYLLREDRRTPNDRVAITTDEKGRKIAEMWYWHSLKQKNVTDELCNAYQWILVGRMAKGRGAAEALEKHKSIQQIYLVFFDVEEGTKRGSKKGEILPTQKIHSFLKIGVDRSSLLAKPADWKALKEEMKGGKCAEIGNKYLDFRWFDQDYLRGKE